MSFLRGHPCLIPYMGHIRIARKYAFIKLVFCHMLCWIGKLEKFSLLACLGDYKMLIFYHLCTVYCSD